MWGFGNTPLPLCVCRVSQDREGSASQDCRWVLGCLCCPLLSPCHQGGSGGFHTLCFSQGDPGSAGPPGPPVSLGVWVGVLGCSALGDGAAVGSHPCHPLCGSGDSVVPSLKGTNTLSCPQGPPGPQGPSGMVAEKGAKVREHPPALGIPRAPHSCCPSSAGISGPQRCHGTPWTTREQRHGATGESCALQHGRCHPPTTPPQSRSNQGVSSPSSSSQGPEGQRGLPGSSGQPVGAGRHRGLCQGLGVMLLYTIMTQKF